MKTEYPWKEVAVIGVFGDNDGAPPPKLVLSGPSLGQVRLIEVFFGEDPEPFVTMRLPMPGEPEIPDDPRARKVAAVISGYAAITATKTTRLLALLALGIRTGNQDQTRQAMERLSEVAMAVDQSILASLNHESKPENN